MRKVVPQSQSYIDVAFDMVRARLTDCSAFAQLFTEHGNWSMVHQGKVFQQAELEALCTKHPFAALSPKLTQIYPAFTSSNMLVEVTLQRGVQLVPALAQVHFCAKTKRIVEAKVFRGESNFLPATYRALGDNLLLRMFQNHDCSQWSSFLEPDAVVEFNGEPKAVTSGLASLFSSAVTAQDACSKKANKEKRIQTHSTLTVRSHFYDHAKKELVILAERHVAVIFGGGMKTQPVAAVFQFSAADKIKALRFFETEVVHIQQKWGAKYGGKPLPSLDKAPTFPATPAGKADTDKKSAGQTDATKDVDTKDCYFDKECHAKVDWAQISKVKKGVFARLRLWKEQQNKEAVQGMLPRLHKLFAAAGMPEDRIDYIIHKWVKFVYPEALAKDSGELSHGAAAQDMDVVQSVRAATNKFLTIVSAAPASFGSSLHLIAVVLGVGFACM
jgi:hypothetical protein